MGAKQTDTECRNTEKFDHKVSQFYVGAIWQTTACVKHLGTEKPTFTD